MSGGYLGYFHVELNSHVGDFGDKELDDLVKDLAKLFYAREWFLSGDTNEGTWVEARDAFKTKWFSETGRQERIETYLDDVKNEVLSSFGFNTKYCKNCKHWEKEEEPYGICNLDKKHLIHRSETCDKFERK